MNKRRFASSSAVRFFFRRRPLPPPSALVAPSISRHLPLPAHSNRDLSSSIFAELSLDGERGGDIIDGRSVVDGRSVRSVRSALPPPPLPAGAGDQLTEQTPPSSSSSSRPPANRDLAARERSLSSALRLSGDSKPASSKPSPAASLAIASNRDAGDDDDDEEFGRLAHLSGEARLRPAVAASRASEPEPEPSRRRLVPVPGGAYTPGTYLVPGEDAAEATLDAAGDGA